MDLAAVLAPRRSLVVPTLVVLAPLLWFGYRGATAPSHVTGAFEPTPGAVLAVVAGSVAVSYLLGAAIAAALSLDGIDPGRPLAGALARPSDAALALVAVVAVAVVGYLVAAQFAAFPGWLDAVLELLGLVVGLPLAVVYAGFFVVANALAFESFALEAVAVAVGVSLSVVWVFLLAGGAAAMLGASPGLAARG